MQRLEPISARSYGSQGPTVVVLHGGPGAPGSAASLARALAHHFRILEPLQRHSGQVSLTVARHVEDLREVAPRPAILIGCSWGAMLGLSYAARYPKEVSSLILVGCGTYDLASREIHRKSLEKLLGLRKSQIADRLKERLATAANPEERDAILAELGELYMFAESYDRLAEEGIAAPRLSVDQTGHIETWTDVLRLQRERVEPQAFCEILAPVLMIHGDRDPHPGPATRDLLRQYIPRLEYFELERCGHEPWRERHARDRFIELLRQWCTRPRKPQSCGS